MSSQSVWRTSFLFITCFTLVARSGNAVEPAEGEQIRALAASYVANVESFTQMECEYDVIQYRPESEKESVEELFAGGLKPEGSARGVWIRAGSTVRCELNVDDETLIEARKREWIIFCPRRVLIDGVSGIHYNRSMNGGVLYSREYPPEELPLAPFDFGRFTGSTQLFSPALPLTEHKEFKLEVELLPGPPPDEPNAAKSDVELVGVKYSLSSGPADVMELRFWLDPSRGALPIIGIAHLRGRLFQKMVVTDVRTFGEHRAFPMRSIHMQYDGMSESNVLWAIETRVRKLTVDAPIDPALLRIEVDKKARLRNAADDNSQFHFEEGGSVGMADVPALMERAAAQSKQEAEWKKINAEMAALAQTQTDTSEPEKRSLLLYANAGLLLVLAFTLVIVLIRKRRGTAADSR